jgi:hypothetical protein
MTEEARFKYKDKISVMHRDMVREFRIPVPFMMPQPLVKKLSDQSLDDLQEILLDTKNKLDLVSRCIGIFTFLSIRLHMENKSKKASKMEKKLADLMVRVEDLTKYGIRESLKIQSD